MLFIVAYLLLIASCATTNYQASLVDSNLQEAKNNSQFLAQKSTLANLSELKLQNGDLLLLDIDMTLLYPAPKEKKYIVPPTPIEKNICQIIDQFSNQGVTILALTARDPKHSKKTDEHLLSIGIDLSKQINVQQIKSEYFKTKMPGKGYFENGIIYGKRPVGVPSVKGEALSVFLQFFARHPSTHQKNNDRTSKEAIKNFPISKIQRIVFVDDKEENLVSVASILSRSPHKNIPFLIYQFSRQAKH
jgi:hypothetical protein